MNHFCCLFKFSCFIRSQPNELCYRINHVNEFAATKQEKENALDIECNTVFKQNLCISSFFLLVINKVLNETTARAQQREQFNGGNEVRLGVSQDRLRSSGCWCSAAYTTIYSTVVSTRSVFQHNCRLRGGGFEESGSC